MPRTCFKITGRGGGRVGKGYKSSKMRPALFLLELSDK